MWQAQVLTLFPDWYPGPLGASLAGKALEGGLWSLDVFDIRDYADNKHRNVDDTPAGGGPGMVMRPDVVGQAIDAALAQQPEGTSRDDWPVLYLSPRGKVLDQSMARELANTKGVTLLCGRFEGVDQRVLDARQIREVSLGDFILSGGDLAAMALMDAVIRLIPGVIGDPDTLEEESFEGGLLEYPHYTRPRVWEGLEIPAVLQSGHHGNIRAWRKEQAEKLTREKRPDLWRRYQSNESETDEKYQWLKES